MLYRLVVAVFITMSASVTSAVPAVLDPRGDAPMDARLARLEAKVTALGLHGEDAPDALVKEKTGGKYKSCAHVAAQGLCGDELAQMACATSCKAATKVKKEVVTEAKKKPASESDRMWQVDRDAAPDVLDAAPVGEDVAGRVSL